MPLNIKNTEAHAYAKELSELTGKTITEAVTEALKEALERKRAASEDAHARLVRELDGIAEFCSSLTVLDDRSPGEILGYDENGVPG